METKAERVARAWCAAREWFEVGADKPPPAMHVTWSDVDTARLRATLAWLEKQATSSFTSSVWRPGQVLDRGVAGVGPCLDALAAGRLAAFSLHYELPLERQTLAFLLSILRQEGGGLALRGFTRRDLVRPELGAEVAFGTIAGHALELEERLGAAGTSLGPERHDFVRPAASTGEP